MVLTTTASSCNRSSTCRVHRTPGLQPELNWQSSSNSRTGRSAGWTRCFLSSGNLRSGKCEEVDTAARLNKADFCRQRELVLLPGSEEEDFRRSSRGSRTTTCSWSSMGFRGSDSTATSIGARTTSGVRAPGADTQRTGRTVRPPRRSARTSVRERSSRSHELADCHPQSRATR